MTQVNPFRVAQIKNAIGDDFVSHDVAQAIAELFIESMVEANKMLMEDEGAPNMLSEEHVRACAHDYVQDALADLTNMVCERIKNMNFTVNATVKTTVQVTTNLTFE